MTSIDPSQLEMLLIAHAGGITLHPMLFPLADFDNKTIWRFIREWKELQMKEIHLKFNATCGEQGSFLTMRNGGLANME